VRCNFRRSEWRVVKKKKKAKRVKGGWRRSREAGGRTKGDREGFDIENGG
jgi:hypothetical protein